MTDCQNFQDAYAHIHCYGCGGHNPAGLQIKSRWLEPGVSSVCTYQPQRHQCAGPASCVNGGIIATVLDCHAVCTAMAAAYRAEGRSLDSAPVIQYATANLSIDFQRPARIELPLAISATIVSVEGKKTRLQLEARSDGVVCATASVLAVRVPADWQS